MVPAQRVGDAGTSSAICGIEAGGNTGCMAASCAARGGARHMEDPGSTIASSCPDGLANVGPSSPEELGRLRLPDEGGHLDSRRSARLDSRGT